MKRHFEFSDRQESIDKVKALILIGNRQIVVAHTTLLSYDSTNGFIFKTDEMYLVDTEEEAYELRYDIYTDMGYDLDNGCDVYDDDVYTITSLEKLLKMIDAASK